MKSIITEELRFRKRVCEYAIKHSNNAEAARRYHTSRQQVQRWVKRYDGTVESLRLHSRKPHSHPNQHTKDELNLIKRMYSKFKHEGLPQVYVEAQKRGYKRSYGSMLRQIRKHIESNNVVKTTPKSRWKPDVVTYPGEKVQIDIKYVPRECLAFSTQGKSYYQITAIDEYSRKRVLDIVDEKSVTNTSQFLLELEAKMGFSIKTIQTDNGREFTNYGVKDRECLFDIILRKLGIQHKTTRPFSPWQNGKVERSHRIDGERFYSRKFYSLDSFLKAHKRYANRYNNIVQKVLNFKSPNQVVTEYFQSISL